MCGQSIFLHFTNVILSVIISAGCSMAPLDRYNARIDFGSGNAEIKSVADMRINSFRYVGRASVIVEYLTDSANKLATAQMTKVQLVFEPPNQHPEMSGFAPSPNDPMMEIELSDVTIREAIMEIAIKAKWLPPYERWDGFFYIKALRHH